MGRKNQGPIYRRDIIKIATGLPAMALMRFPYPDTATASGGPSATGSLKTQPSHPHILDPHQWHTLRILCDLILPADANSGSAGEAGVPEFIDYWLSLKQGLLADQIRGGLTWLDWQCQNAFGFRFRDCPPARQKEMLDRIAYPGRARPADYAGVEFFNRLRDLVVSAFFTSRIGVRGLHYLGNEPQASWNGCPPAVVELLHLNKL